MSKDLYGSDTALITAGIIHDATEGKTQDTINAAQKKAGIYFGTCSTAASTQEKTVTIDGITSLYDGLMIRVRFTNRQDYSGCPTLNLNSLGAKSIKRAGGTNTNYGEWIVGEVLDLIYVSDTGYWTIVDGGVASTSAYGMTMLSTSVTSTSTATAATPSAVKTVNDKVGSGTLVGFTATDLTGAANELKTSLNQIEDAIAYVQDGDTASRTYTAGQFVYLKNHPTLAEGLYTVNDSIPQGNSVTGHMTADPSGGLNSLKNTLVKHDVSMGGQSVSTGLFEIQFSFTPLTGYTPYGIIGYDLSRLAGVSIDGVFINGNGQIDILGYNSGSAATTGGTIYVLEIKS